METITYSRYDREHIRNFYRARAIDDYFLPAELVSDEAAVDSQVVEGIVQLDIATGITMLSRIANNSEIELRASGIAMGVDFAQRILENLINPERWPLKSFGLCHLPCVPLITVLGVVFDEACHDTTHLRWDEIENKLNRDTIHNLHGGERLSRIVGAAALALLDHEPESSEFTDRRSTVVQAAILASDFILEQIGIVAYENRPRSGNYK